MTFSFWVASSRLIVMRPQSAVGHQVEAKFFRNPAQKRALPQRNLAVRFTPTGGLDQA
jgi:hypothetical protein